MSQVGDKNNLSIIALDDVAWCCHLRGRRRPRYEKSIEPGCI